MDFHSPRLSHYTDFFQDFSHDTIFLCDLAKTFQDWAKTFQKKPLEKKPLFFAKSWKKSANRPKASKSWPKVLVLEKVLEKSLGQKTPRIFSKTWPRLSAKTFGQDFEVRTFFNRLDFVALRTPFFYPKKDSFSRIGPRL